MWHESIRSVLIDTDIGDDVDDAFGLALALRMPQLRVRGVTTVSGVVQARAQLAQTLLIAAGYSDVPVAPGSSTMSDGRAGSNRFSHQAVLELSAKDSGLAAESLPIPSSQSLDSNRQPSNATELILACSHSAAPLTIIALGPLTNIAAALAHDPALAQRARLVAMAGKL